MDAPVLSTPVPDPTVMSTAAIETSAQSIRDHYDSELKVRDAEVKALSKRLKSRKSHEREVLGLQIKNIRADRDLQHNYERRLTDLQFAKVQALSDEHKTFHDREHLLYEEAVSRASLTVSAQVQVIAADITRLREEGHTYLTVDRFEREHKALGERTDLAVKGLGDKIEASNKALGDKMEASIGALTIRLGTEEKVTIRQDATQALLDKIGQNNRWLVGIAIGLFGTFITTFLHIMGIIK